MLEIHQRELSPLVDFLKSIRLMVFKQCLNGVLMPIIQQLYDSIKKPLFHCWVD